MHHSTFSSIRLPGTTPGSTIGVLDIGNVHLTLGNCVFEKNNLLTHDFIHYFSVGFTTLTYSLANVVFKENKRSSLTTSSLSPNLNVKWDNASFINNSNGQITLDIGSQNKLVTFSMSNSVIEDNDGLL